MRNQVIPAALRVHLAVTDGLLPAVNSGQCDSEHSSLTNPNLQLAVNRQPGHRQGTRRAARNTSV